MRTERVTVTLPGDQTEKLRELVAAQQAASVSSYVADAVGRKLARDAALRRLEQRSANHLPRRWHGTAHPRG